MMVGVVCLYKPRCVDIKSTLWGEREGCSFLVYFFFFFVFFCFFFFVNVPLSVVTIFFFATTLFSKENTR